MSAWLKLFSKIVLNASVICTCALFNCVLFNCVLLSCGLFVCGLSSPALAVAQGTLTRGTLKNQGLEAPVPGDTLFRDSAGEIQPYFTPLDDSTSAVYESRFDKASGLSPQDSASQGLSSGGLIRLNTDLFAPLLDFQNRQSNKELLLLDSKQPGEGVVLTIGGQARLSILAAHTNTANKFNYMGRFPTDFTGTNATDARMLQANAAMAVQINSWAHVYGETLFSDVFSFGDFKQGSFQVRQAYAVFGDLEATPWYAYIGKKNVSFGDMGTLSPFSQSMVWHYFGALQEGAGVGYAGDGLDFSFAALNGGRGIRVADSESKGKLNNFAANATWNRATVNGAWQVGTGFLLGTIYDGPVAEHLDPTLFGKYNSAWDIHAKWTFNRWTLAGEYVTTVNDWPATGHAVTAYRTEAAYDLVDTYFPTRVSVSWSEGIQGDAGPEFEFNRQLVLGMGSQLNQNAFASLEYVHGSGFAPLMGITTASDRGVQQDSIVAGLVLVF